MNRLAILALAAACSSPANKPPPPTKPLPPRVTVDDDHDQPEPDVGDEGQDDQTFDVVVDEPPKAKLYDEANRIFASMRESAYIHKTTVDEATGRFEFDCSGFVGYALKKSQPRALRAVQRATVKRPLAKHFVAFFENIPEKSPWRRITRAIDLEPGDVIAWLKPDDVVTKNTGHVMIVHGEPRQDPKHDDVVIVPIIDSTGVPHGTGDSRKRRRATGLGTGEVLLVVDATGAPIAYRWSRGKKATVHTTTIALAGLRTAD